jgi:hypothetical protein
MDQIGQRPVAAGRDAGAVRNVQTGRLHDTTIDPIDLPPRIAWDYRCACSEQASIHLHHRVIMRLLEVES